MNRINGKIVGLMALSLVSKVEGANSIKNEQKPNILFIAVDDLRPELGCFGVQGVKSPNIDALAKNGIIFSQAYCQSSVCNPSRASLLTGMRPNSTNVFDLNTDLRKVSPSILTLPQYFKQNGYYTVSIGKIFHNIFPDPQSWSEPELHIDGYPFDPDAVYRSAENEKYINARKTTIIDEGRQNQYIDRYGQWYLKASATENIDIPDNAYYDGAQTDVAIEKLAELTKKGTPFFFGIGYYRPHLPFNAPKKYWDLYNESEIPLAENKTFSSSSPVMAISNMRELKGYTDFKHVVHPTQGRLTDAEARFLKHGYWASISYIDAQIGRLMVKLKALNLLDNTIIVLWGDNGYKLGEHGSWCKMTNYQVDTRVPLLFSMSKLKTKNVNCSQIVEMVDIFPTLCDMAGLKTPSNIEGRSLMPLINQPKTLWDNTAYSQYLSEGIWAAPDGKSYMGYAVRTPEFLYVEWYNWDTKVLAAIELYNLSIDPMENNNVVADLSYSTKIERLSKLLKTKFGI